ncbi:MAG: hypothetical protein PHE27_06670 [Alphaproteobacteria bacterium]|nr:hypothetical protein [Alphaproteobacteria bacterium]
MFNSLKKISDSLFSRQKADSQQPSPRKYPLTASNAAVKEYLEKLYKKVSRQELPASKPSIAKYIETDLIGNLYAASSRERSGTDASVYAERQFEPIYKEMENAPENRGIIAEALIKVIEMLPQIAANGPKVAHIAANQTANLLGVSGNKLFNDLSGTAIVDNQSSNVLFAFAPEKSFFAVAIRQAGDKTPKGSASLAFAPIKRTPDAIATAALNYSFQTEAEAFAEKTKAIPAPSGDEKNLGQKALERLAELGIVPVRSETAPKVQSPGMELK